MSWAEKPLSFEARETSITQSRQIGKQHNTALPAISHQRSEGEIAVAVGKHGLVRLREGGAAKARFPSTAQEVILINTGGGLAGGDRFAFTIEVREAAQLAVTTQAAERAYRSLGPASHICVNLRTERDARLFWMPQELIVFDRAAVQRQIDVELAPASTFLAVEAIVFGRKAMGETIKQAKLRDRWRVRSAGQLVHAEDMAVSGPPPSSPATLGENGAMATVLLVAPHAADMTDMARGLLPADCGASSWNGKLVARLVAKDGFELRNRLIPLLSSLVGASGMPKVWSM